MLVLGGASEFFFYDFSTLVIPQILKTQAYEISSKWVLSQKKL